MFAVVEIQGKQYEVRVNDVIHVDTLGLEADKKVSFDKVLLVHESDSSIKIGTPYVEGVTVDAVSLGEEKGEKVRVFKMKAKKRYRRTKGHRSHLTALKIVAVAGSTAELKRAHEADKPKKVKKKAAPTTTKAAPKKSTTTKKEPATKKAPAKKPAAKKTTTKKTTEKKD